MDSNEQPSLDILLEKVVANKPAPTGIRQAFLDCHRPLKDTVLLLKVVALRCPLYQLAVFSSARFLRLPIKHFLARLA